MSPRPLRPPRRIVALVVVGGVVVAAAAVATVVGQRHPAAPAAMPTTMPSATVTVVGRAGSFGALGDLTPSGHTLAAQPARDWAVPAGHAFGPPAVASDGTVLVPVSTQALSPAVSTAFSMTVATYDPATNQYATVEIGRASSGPAPSLVSLLPIGDQIAFAVGDASRAGPSTAGAWPTFGLLSTVEGQWRVAQSWTAAELGLDERGLLRMARLPASGDLVLTRPGGEVVTVRLGRPDPRGRVTAQVVARLPYDVAVEPGQVVVDPTAPRGAERFAVTLRPVLNPPAEDPSDAPPQVLQEFGYDADADAGQLWLDSAPMLPGDASTGTPRPQLFSYGAIRYDRRGNLWAGRAEWTRTGALALYTGQRCRHDQPVASYRASSGTRSVWGRACPPDYDIAQAQSLGPAFDIVEDPASGDLAMVSLGGRVMAVRVTGEGETLEFQIGNVLDVSSTLLPMSPTLWPMETPGGFDPSGRLWLTVSQHQIGPPPALRVGLHAPQWLTAVAVRDLFDPAPVELSAVPGRDTVIQAERVVSFATRQVPRDGKPTFVDSDVLVTPCVTWPANLACAYDGTPGNGFAVNDNIGYGHQLEPLDYRIRVPTAGQYRIGFLVSTFKDVTAAAIDLTAGGRTYRTSVYSIGDFRLIWVAMPVALDAGDQTMRVAAPVGGEYWFLNSIVARRA